MTNGVKILFKDPLVLEFEEYCATEGRTAVTTAREYARDIDIFGRWLDPRASPSGIYPKLLRASVADVRRFMVQLRTLGRGNSTVRRVLTALRLFYAQQIKANRRTDDPTRGVPFPERQARNVQFLTKSEVRSLLDAPTGFEKERDKALIALFLCGLKLSQVTTLNVTDVDWKKLTATVRYGSSRRPVPLSEDAAEALAVYRELRPASADRALFIGRRGKRLGGRQVWHRVKLAAQECDLEQKASPAVLRNTRAVHALRGGMRADVLMKILGHLTASTTQAYFELAAGEYNNTEPSEGFERLLHPLIIQHSMKHYHDGDYRESVANAMLALTETIRARTGLDSDTTKIANTAFNPQSPILLFSPMTTVTERDEHDGFHKIMLGAFQGIRNPKTHLLIHDLDEIKTAQYLVFISLLIRRVDEAQLA